MQLIFKCVHKDCISELRLRVILNYYFTKYYFSIFKEVFSNPNEYFMYASKTALLEYNDLPKMIFCSENMFLLGLEGCLEYLKFFETCLN
jgi:hypothetical protein